MKSSFNSKFGTSFMKGVYDSLIKNMVSSQSEHMLNVDYFINFFINHSEPFT